MPIVPRRAARRRRRTALALALAAAALSGPACAERWTVDNVFESRYEWNDNILLVPHSPGAVNTLSIASTLDLARQTESAATRLTLAATALGAEGRSGQSRVDGRVAGTQSLSDTLDTWTASAQYSQDYNDAVQTADVTLGRGRRRVSQATATWLRTLTERLETNASLSYVRTSYGEQLSEASSYGDASGQATITYRLDEIDTLDAQAAHSQYRTLDGRSTSKTDSVAFGGSRRLSEKGSLSLNVGYYRTRSTDDGFVSACPIEQSFCDSGLVSPVVYLAHRVATSTGLQYSASYQHRFDERTTLAFSAARQQTPSGAGTVVRNDSINASVVRQLSERTTISATFAQSRSTFEVQGDATVGQRSLAFAFERELASDLKLTATVARTEGEPIGNGDRPRSTSVSLALRYEWPKTEPAR